MKKKKERKMHSSVTGAKKGNWVRSLAKWKVCLTNQKLGLGNMLRFFGTAPGLCLSSSLCVVCL